MSTARNGAHDARVRHRFASLHNPLHGLEMLLERLDVARRERAPGDGANALRVLLVGLFVNRQTCLREERLKAAGKGARIGLDSGVKLLE